MVCAVKRRTAVRAVSAIVTLSWLAALPAAPAAPAAAAAPGSGPDVLRIPFPQYDGGLTPYTFELGYPLMTLVYDTLLWRDAQGVPRPWLARSVQRSEGGRRLTVRLRGNARWHDGRPVTARDVAFTFGYFAARQQPRFTPQLSAISSVRATGRLTARIDLRRPSLGFDDQPLADVPILPAHLWRDLPASRRAPAGRAIGSGPYRLVRATRAGGYVLRANRAYYRAAPRVAEIRVPIIGDAQDTYRALRDRRIDMVPLSLPRPAAARLDNALGVAVRRGPSYQGTALVLNVRRAPFRTRRARQAVAAALDLGRIARNAAPAEPAAGGFVHPEARWAAGADVHRVDVAAARRAFERLRLPTIRVLAPENDPVRSEAGRQVVLALQRAGARATLVEVSSGELSRTIGEDGTAGDFDAAITSVPPLVSRDPDYLRAMFGSDPASAPLNVSGYRSEAFDAVARRVAAAPDEASRQVAILEELRLLARDAPAIALFFSQGAFAYRASVYNGWTFVTGSGILDKRSFLPGGGPASDAPAAAQAPFENQADDDASAFGVLSIISLVVLAIVIALALYALAQRRRRT